MTLGGSQLLCMTRSSSDQTDQKRESEESKEGASGHPLASVSYTPHGRHLVGGDPTKPVDSRRGVDTGHDMDLSRTKTAMI